MKKLLLLSIVAIAVIMAGCATKCDDTPTITFEGEMYKLESPEPIDFEYGLDLLCFDRNGDNYYVSHPWNTSASGAGPHQVDYYFSVLTNEYTKRYWYKDRFDMYYYCFAYEEMPSEFQHIADSYGIPIRKYDDF